MARVFPQADLADGFRIGVGCFEGGHLSVGDGFTDESDQCDPCAKDGKKIVGRVGIGGDEVEWQCEQEDGQRLAEEEQEKHRVHFSVPDFAEFLIAGVFRGMMFRYSAGEVVAEPNRPCGDEDAGDERLGAGAFDEKEKHGSQTDAECPKRIDWRKISNFHAERPCGGENDQVSNEGGNEHVGWTI